MTSRWQGLPLLRRRVANGADEYHDLEAFCVFAGYRRSGHSLIGSLLDAHPDIVIAHEAHALKLLDDGRSRPELFERLIENSNAQAGRPKGRRATGYSYAVEGQWQGRVRRLRVLGDKEGQKTTIRFGRDPSELKKLERIAGAPLRIIHVTRNPYDIIARLSLITHEGVPERSVSAATGLFARLARINDRLIASRQHPVLTIRHESFVRQPKQELRATCEFLGVEAEEPYLDACAKLVFSSPKRTRELIEWTNDEVAAVREVIARHPFLDGYSFSSED